ncbi:ATP-binding protein [Candidatus Woesearchaeota archaeon]|nr:ATP-binding protein [Candidatus Woesearchaeota archaeon]
MEWFEEFGFDENPFSTDPAFSARSSAGLEKPLADLEYYINSGSIVFVEGAEGSGKSVLLQKLSGKLGGRVVFIDAVLGDVDVTAIVKSRASLLGRLLGNSPRNLVLLVDNAAALSPRSLELLKYHYDNNHFGAVVLAGTVLKSSGLSPSVIDRIGNRVVKVPALAEEDALLMVRNRLGNSGLFSEEVVRKIYKLSGKNARRFLQLCERACKEAAAAKSSSVGEEHLASLSRPVGDV